VRTGKVVISGAPDAVDDQKVVQPEQQWSEAQGPKSTIGPQFIRVKIAD
jgi:hypothetical protein